MFLTRRKQEMLRLMRLDEPGTLLGMELDSIHAMFQTADGQEALYIAFQEWKCGMATFLKDKRPDPKRELGAGAPATVFKRLLKALDRHKRIKRVVFILTTKDGETLMAMFDENTDGKSWVESLSSDYCTKYRLHRLADFYEIFFGKSA